MPQVARPGNGKFGENRGPVPDLPQSWNRGARRRRGSRCGPGPARRAAAAAADAQCRLAASPSRMNVATSTLGRWPDSFVCCLCPANFNLKAPTPPSPAFPLRGPLLLEPHGPADRWTAAEYYTAEVKPILENVSSATNFKFPVNGRWRSNLNSNRDSQDTPNGDSVEIAASSDRQSRTQPLIETAGVSSLMCRQFEIVVTQETCKAALRLTRVTSAGFVQQSRPIFHVFMPRLRDSLFNASKRESPNRKSGSCAHSPYVFRSSVSRKIRVFTSSPLHWGVRAWGYRSCRTIQCTG